MKIELMSFITKLATKVFPRIQLITNIFNKNKEVLNIHMTIKNEGYKFEFEIETTS